ncbi:hypothetical protein FACS189487_10100 [Campylobacterota bacterium]|nr:hypothetical protein FACS189487_10100 [Campylobacterota bacterium]
MCKILYIPNIIVHTLIVYTDKDNQLFYMLADQERRFCESANAPKPTRSNSAKIRQKDSKTAKKQNGHQL